MVPLGLKHVGFQEGDVVPDHLDKGLVGEGKAVMPHLRRLGCVPGCLPLTWPHGLWESSGSACPAGGTFRNPDSNSDTSPSEAWPGQASTRVLSPSPPSDPLFSLYFTEERN